MSFYYAQINENNICNAVSEVASEIDNPTLISVDSLDSSILGKLWNGSSWIEQPQSEEN